MPDVQLICANARAIPLADESVQCVVTSPPYWGLRKYAGEQDSVWGGLANCGHVWSDFVSHEQQSAGSPKQDTVRGSCDFVGVCGVCGAWRGAFGLEPTPEMYVNHTIEILREVRRVLRKDGVVFWNIGDSYAGSVSNNGGFSDKSALSGFTSPNVKGRQLESAGASVKRFGGAIKPKDLALIPFRVALESQADGWWVRSVIIWHKPNPMPESITDRPTRAHEYILMLTKSERYFWDQEAVMEQGTGDGRKGGHAIYDAESGHTNGVGSKSFHQHTDKRNLRNVWEFPTQPYKGAHFATFPEEIPRRCIKAASKPGDMILDPFGGSGTTGRVAKELDRNAVLLDIAYNDKYAVLAEKRTSNVQAVMNF